MAIKKKWVATEGPKLTLEKEAKLVLTENLQDLPGYGHIMTLNEFIKNCESGGFIDDDGFGNYALENKMSDISVYPSDVLNENIDQRWTHVMWFNR